MHTPHMQQIQMQIKIIVHTHPAHSIQAFIDIVAHKSTFAIHTETIQSKPSIVAAYPAFNGFGANATRMNVLQHGQRLAKEHFGLMTERTGWVG